MKKVTVEIDGEELVFNLEDKGFELDVHREVSKEGEILIASPITEFKLTGLILNKKAWSIPENKVIK